MGELIEGLAVSVAMTVNHLGARERGDLVNDGHTAAIAVEGGLELP